MGRLLTVDTMPFYQRLEAKCHRYFCNRGWESKGGRGYRKYHGVVTEGWGYTRYSGSQLKVGGLKETAVISITSGGS